MSTGLSEANSIVAQMHLRHTQVSQWGKPMMLALTLPFLAIFLMGLPLISDMKHELISSVRGMPMATESTRLIELSPDQFHVVYVHEYIDTVYDYHQYITSHYNTSTDMQNNTLTVLLSRLTPYVPDLRYEEMDIGVPVHDILSKGLQDRIHTMVYAVALSALPSIGITAILAIRMIQFQRLVSKSYCENCKHALVLHLGRDWEFHRCEKRVRIPKDQLDPTKINKYLPPTDPCACTNFKLLPYSTIGKKPGQVKVAVAPIQPGLFMLGCMCLMMLFTPILHTFDPAGDGELAADLKLGKHAELAKEMSYVTPGHYRTGSETWKIELVQ